MSKQRFFTPGKLYIAGEYFVVNGDANAIIVPLNLGIEFTVEKADFFSIYLGKYNASYTFDPLEEENNLPNTTIKSILSTVYKILTTIDIQYYPVKISVESTLESVNKVSYGFGSNGALIIGIIKALSSFYGVELSPLMMYKIGVLSQKDYIDNSSFGDLATSAFMSPIIYHVFDKEWFKNQVKEDLYAICNQEWVGLEITKFVDPIPINLVVNTRIKADSFALVNNFKKVYQSKGYQNYVDTYTKLYDEFLSTKGLSVLSKFNQLYKEMDTKYNLGLYINPFKEIEDIAKRYHGYSKFSGAGAGDNMIIFFDNDQDKLDCQYELIKHKFLVFNQLIEG